MPSGIDITISISCNVVCPSLKARYYFDFKLIDPSGKDYEAFKEVIKTLDTKLDSLLRVIQTNSLKGFIC